MNVVNMSQSHGNAGGQLQFYIQSFWIGFSPTHSSIELFQRRHLAVQNTLRQFVDGGLSTVPVELRKSEFKLFYSLQLLCTIHTIQRLPIHVHNERAERQPFHGNCIPPMQFKILLQKFSLDA